MVVARLTLVAISITSQEGPSKLLVLLRILGNLLHDLVDISFVISALWTISLCKVILKKKLSYLIGILKKSRCIWNWRWFEECSFGKVKYDIQIIERWLVGKRSSVNLKKKLKRKKITKRKNDVFKMTKEDIFQMNFWRHYISRFALSINLSECRNSLSF